MPEDSRIQSMPVVLSHSILDEIASLATQNRALQQEIGNRLAQRTDALDLVRYLHSARLISDDEMGFIYQYWVAGGTLNSVCAKFSEAFDFLNADSDHRFEGHLVFGVVDRPAAVSIQIGNKVIMLVLAPPGTDGFFSKLTNSSDDAFRHELEAIHNYVSFLMAGAAQQ